MVIRPYKRNMKRTDCHRPSAIVPADYTAVVYYSNGSVLNRSHSVSCAGDCPREGHCCVAWARARATEEIGREGKCGVCGAAFCYGVVFQHNSGAIVHMGEDCANKYEMLFDHSQVEGMREANAAELMKHKRQQAFDKFCAANEGLAAALEQPHRILADLRDRLLRFGDLSEKQVALALKIANEKPESHIAAPVSDKRVTFAGTIVSAKTTESQYGLQYKMTVRVDGEGGSWLANGTVPKQLLDGVSYTSDPRNGNAVLNVGSLKGRRVEVTAKLQTGNDAHFAFMSRPAAKWL